MEELLSDKPIIPPGLFPRVQRTAQSVAGTWAELPILKMPHLLGSLESEEWLGKVEGGSFYLGGYVDSCITCVNHSFKGERAWVWKWGGGSNLNFKNRGYMESQKTQESQKNNTDTIWLKD